MIGNGKNFSAQHIGALENLADKDFFGLAGKYFIGKELGLSGCEISLNRVPAGQGMPFVHSHKKNEEVYIFLRGNGMFHVDGSEFPVQEGSVVRVAPEGERTWTAGDEDLYFICIQAETGTLTQATREDGIRLESKASWMK